MSKVQNMENGNEADEKCTVSELRINKILYSMPSDYLYHLGLGTGSHDLEKMFGDVRFVCMGGSSDRMEGFAHYIKDVIKHELPVGSKLDDLCRKSNRFAFYKVGPVLSISHGMGMPSMSILLHEMIKLVHYAKCKDPIFIRIGTCGGLGVEPGTVVVTKDAYNGLVKNEHEFVILGQRVSRPANFDRKIAEEIAACADSNDDFDTVLANTMATDDFYEGQGRTDGAVCDHTEAGKMEFLKILHEKGIRNIEMEACMFSALTKHVGIKSGNVCVTLIDRLKGDQVTTPLKAEMEKRPQVIVGRFIQKKLGLL